MHLIIKILKDGEKVILEKDMKKISNTYYIFKWSAVLEDGAYSFIINNRAEKTIKNITFSHTAPFSKVFEAYTSLNEGVRPIAGIRKDDDILIEYFPKDDRVVLKRMKFTKFRFDIGEYGFKSAKKVEMPGSFNSWNIFAEELKNIQGTIYETDLALENGVYEYKFVIDGHWVPADANRRLIIGEVSTLFQKGEIGNGKFVYDAIDNYDTRKAIKHDMLSFEYLNKISLDEIETTIRCQGNDISSCFIHINEDGIESIYEMERVYDSISGFDYFKRVINFKINSIKFSYYFELKDGGSAVFFGKNGISKEVESFEADYLSGIIPCFSVAEWAKDAVWYNIFPDRFYNADKENDPIYNEFGPEYFEKPEERADFIEEFKWGAAEKTYSKFELNGWCEDFENAKEWEKLKGMEVDYSLKYARMYGGDLKGIKEKIPYLKELGINAIWLNPVFFSDSNHKYGAGDFRHISPDLGTMKMSGNNYNIEIAADNKYGNKSYIDVLKDYKNENELKLLRVILKGENKGKNGYFETEDPKSWVWSESDLIAVDLIKELHKNGIRVIFDGVFNHSGTTHWSFEAVMAEGEKSKYTKWYKFHDFKKFKEIKDINTDEEAYKILVHNKANVHYSGWAGFTNLPEFNTYNRDYMEYIYNITKKWMLGPDGKSSENWMEDDGIDGWRLDVPNCVENQEFWHEWREIVKSCKKDGYITAELWGDARGDINPGKKYDTVMNYEWLKAIIGFFINKGEHFDKRYKLKATDFFAELREKRYWYPRQSLLVSQNLNGSHDTDRLISRIVNDRLGRDLEEGKQINKGYNSIRPDLADKEHPNTSINWKESEIKPKDILKLISIFQMTYMGAPMIYYGDEIGMWGATDPYCRKPMIWPEMNFEDETNGSKFGKNEKYSVEADKELFNWYKKIIKIRKDNRVLSRGHFKEIIADDEKDFIVYERFDEDSSIITAINNSEKDIEINIESSKLLGNAIDLISGNMIIINNGIINLKLLAKSGVILKII